MKLLASMAAALGLLGAPYQCGASDPDPARRIEDSAPQALWELAEHFDERGDRRAQRVTLERLVERYPNSRFARRAEQALQRPADGTAPDGDEGRKPDRSRASAAETPRAPRATPSGSDPR